MKCKTFIFVMFLILISSITFSSEISTLYLNEGDNDITLIIKNNCNKDLTDINFIVDNERLPVWLTITGFTQSVDIPEGVFVKEKCKLTFNVSNAPSCATTEIPYTLIDEQGNEWNFQINVHVNPNFSIINRW